MKTEYVTTYNVIPSLTGKRFCVWWTKAIKEGDELFWRGGGYHSSYKTKERADAVAEKLNHE